MGATGLIGLGLQGAQAAAGGKGGGGGGGGGGGISPQEAALAQYNAMQQLHKTQFEFGKTNTGISTMATQAAGGSRLAAALKGAQMSDVNQRVQGQGLQQQAQAAGTAAGQAAGASDQGFSGDQGTLGGDTSGTSV